MKQNVTIENRMFRLFAGWNSALFLWVAFTLTAAQAHDLQYQVQAGPPMVLYFFFPDNSKFSYEEFEIKAPGDSIIFQKGHTDRLGRIALMPDRPGVWRVRVFSEDGHGAIVKVDVGTNQILKDYSRSLFDRYSRVMTGAGIILGIFGIIMLVQEFNKKGIVNEKTNNGSALPPNSPTC
jgi:nickel transport protein